MTVRDDLILEVKSAKTNRLIKHSDSIKKTDASRIEDLIVRYVEHGSSDLESYIEVFIKSFSNRLISKNAIFFRGINASIMGKLNSDQIGPSPCPADGRYNKAGEKCLYLIDTIDFLYSELNSLKILVQRYEMPLSILKIADLSPNNKNVCNSLALAFDMSERGITSSGYPFEKELEKRGKSAYLVSQLLSSLFRKYGWDGMHIPGVHGEQGRHYHNLTIFGSIVDEWKAWAKGAFFTKKKDE